jgi:hypothetical protein
MFEVKIFLTGSIFAPRDCLLIYELWLRNVSPSVLMSEKDILETSSKDGKRHRKILEL